VAEALAGRAQVVWIEGDAGSGKSGFLHSVLHGLPPTFRVLLAEADECAQDVALDVVRQLGPLDASDGFGAGLKLLEAFDTAQDHGPLAVVVEDLHWADGLSRQALLTVARRLRHDKVVLLVTTVARHAR
jgi:predicted ATPase